MTAKDNFGGYSAAAYPALSRVDVRGHSAAAKVTLVAEARSRQSYVRLAATTWAPMTNTRLC